MFTDARTIFVDLHNMFAKVRFAIRSQSVSDVHRPSLSFRRSTQQTFANVRRCLQMIRNSSQLYSAGFDKCLQILPDFRNKFTVFGRFSQNFRWLYLCSQFLNRLQILADVCRFLKGRLAVYVMRAYLVFMRPSFWSMPTHQNLKNCERYGRWSGPNTGHSERYPSESLQVRLSALRPVVAVLTARCRLTTSKGLISRKITPYRLPGLWLRASCPPEINFVRGSGWCTRDPGEGISSSSGPPERG